MCLLLEGKPANAPVTDQYQAVVVAPDGAGDRRDSVRCQRLKADAVVPADQRLAGLAEQEEVVVRIDGARGQADRCAGVDLCPAPATVSAAKGVTAQAVCDNETVGASEQTEEAT